MKSLYIWMIVIALLSLPCHMLLATSSNARFTILKNTVNLMVVRWRRLAEDMFVFAKTEQKLTFGQSRVIIFGVQLNESKF